MGKIMVISFEDGEEVLVRVLSFFIVKTLYYIRKAFHDYRREEKWTQIFC